RYLLQSAPRQQADQRHQGDGDEHFDQGKALLARSAGVARVSHRICETRPVSSASVAPPWPLSRTRTVTWRKLRFSELRISSSQRSARAPCGQGVVWVPARGKACSRRN